MFPSTGSGLKQTEVFVKREAAEVDFQLNMQLDQEEASRAKQDGSQSSDASWRQWQTHEDEFEGRSDEVDDQGTDERSLLSRMWISLVVGLRSVFGGGSDGGSGR